MMTKNLTLGLLAVFSLSGTTLAQSHNNAPPPRPPAEVIEQFDLDGDGRLNEAERNAFRESGLLPQQPSKQDALSQFDQNGDGQLSESEKEAARAARPRCTGGH